MIPPGVIHGLAGAAVGLIRSPLWQPQRRIDASGADWNARCARDYSAEVLRRIDARDRPAAWHGALDGAGDVEAGGRRRPVLAAAGGHERRGAGGGALRQPAQQTRPSADRGTGLGRRASRTEAQARHPVDPVGRIHRREPGRLQLLAVLRAVSILREDAVGDDAPDARRRRAAVRRLRRRRRSGRHRSAHRRNPHGADLRRRAGRLELHLRQGDLDAGAARLDRRPCARLRGDRRRSRTRRAGQRQDRHRQGQLLRSRGQPDLRRDGGPLRNRHPAGEAEEAARQGEGRASRPDRRAMAARQAQAPDLP